MKAVCSKMIDTSLRTFTGRVEQGRFRANDTSGWADVFLHFEGREVLVSVQRKVKKRSNPQNDYLFGVVYKLIADHIGETTDTVHDLMKVRFNSFVKIVDGRKIRIPRSTAKLTTAQFQEYWQSSGPH